MPPEISDSTDLTLYEREIIDLFIHAAQVLSVPRSIGEIYGLIFASRNPISMEEVVIRLRISKGSASQGLRWLRDVGAIRSTYVNGDRRDYYVAETELRKLALGYLRENIEPHLRSGVDYLERIDASIAAVNGEEDRRFARDRLKKLQRWHKFASQILPVFLRVAEKF